MGTPGTVTLTEQTPTNFTPSGGHTRRLQCDGRGVHFHECACICRVVRAIVVAAHDVYLTNGKVVTVSVQPDQPEYVALGRRREQQRQSGSINDLSCIGASFHGAPARDVFNPPPPATAKSADINADGINSTSRIWRSPAATSTRHRRSPGRWFAEHVSSLIRRRQQPAAGVTWVC